MKCPLFEMFEPFGKAYDGAKFCECLKEECAWWDKPYERCDPTGLAHTLERLTDEVAKVQRRMPYEGQFRELRR